MMAKNEDALEDRQARLNTPALLVLLGLVAVCFAVNDLLAAKALGAWQPLGVLAMNLLIVGAIWSLLWLKPWKGWKASGEPVSRATRKTNKLYWLTELIAAVGMLALIYGTNGTDNPWGPFSNGPVSPGIAIFVIASWVLAMAIGLWRYLERR